QRQHTDGHGEEEREGQDRANDFLVQIVSVVLLSNDRAWMDEVLQVCTKKGIGHLEAKNLQASRSGTRAAANEGQVEKHHYGKATPLGVIVDRIACRGDH